MDLFRFDLVDVASHVVLLAIAYVLALPIAWDRESSGRRLGLRTFPMVALASCGFLLLAQGTTPESADNEGRILQGVITGVSFLGAGVIVQRGGGAIRGMATAAAIWVTTAIGGAVALRHYAIAIMLSLVTFLTLRWLEALAGVEDEQPREQSGEQGTESQNQG